MLRPAALALAALLPSSDPISIESPELDKYQITLAVIEIGEGEYQGYYVEGAEEGDIVTGGDPIMMHPARLVRRLAGPPVSDLKRVRRLAGGFRIGYTAPQARVIAFLEPTDQGYYFAQWSERLKGRFACFPENVRTHFKMRFPPSKKPNRDGNICIDV
jgi:hypothetical protein